MNIKVESIRVAENSQELIIDFSTPFGGGQGKWQGVPPEPSQNYDVEFGIEQELAWGKDIIKVEEEKFLISYDQERLILQGKVEETDPDGFVAIRVGTALVIFTATGEPFLVGVFVRVALENVVLHNTNL